MKLKWKRVFDGCWHGFKPGAVNPSAVIEQNDFGRKLWAVEIVGRGKATDGVHDCFPFADAKALAASKVGG